MKRMNFNFLIALSLTITNNLFANQIPNYSESHQSSYRFHDIYHSLAKSKYLQARWATDRQILLPTEDYLNEDIHSGLSLKKISKIHSSYYPTDFFNAGQNREPNLLSIQQINELTSERGPVTVIVIPGIFGEFILHYPFEEIASKASLFSQKYEKSFSDTTDSVYQVVTNEIKEVKLSDTVRIGSIDRNDTSVVNMILLYPHSGSFETLGSFSENNKIYEQRIAKIWELLEERDRENLYLMGYSRGAPVGLELISDLESVRISPEKHWIQDVKGFISLGGVIYGSEVADEALEDQKSPAYKQMATLDRLANTLHPKGRKFMRNSYHWLQAIKDLLHLKYIETTHAGLAVENFKNDKVSINHCMATVKYSLNHLFRFDKWSFLSNYGNNVRNFKKFVESTKAGAQGLSSSARKNWFESHTLPAHIPYFAITGTMADPTSVDGNNPSPLLDSPYYKPGSADYRALRTSFYSLGERSGIWLNDSQVTVTNSTFYSSLLERWNPHQEKLDTHFLGTLGTHHWGFAFPSAVESKGLEKDNPFPRDLLLEAIALYVLEAGK